MLIILNMFSIVYFFEKITLKIFKRILRYLHAIRNCARRGQITWNGLIYTSPTAPDICVVGIIKRILSIGIAFIQAFYHSQCGQLWIFHLVYFYKYFPYFHLVRILISFTPFSELFQQGVFRLYLFVDAIQT